MGQTDQHNTLFLQHIIKDSPYSTSLTLDIILMLLYTIGSIMMECREIDGRLGAQEYIVFINTGMVITDHHMICNAPILPILLYTEVESVGLWLGNSNPISMVNTCSQ